MLFEKITNLFCGLTLYALQLSFKERGGKREMKAITSVWVILGILISKYVKTETMR